MRSDSLRLPKPIIVIQRLKMEWAESVQSEEFVGRFPSPLPLPDFDFDAETAVLVQQANYIHPRDPAPISEPVTQYSEGFSLSLTHFVLEFTAMPEALLVERRWKWAPQHSRQLALPLGQWICLIENGEEFHSESKIYQRSTFNIGYFDRLSGDIFLQQRPLLRRSSTSTQVTVFHQP